MKKCILVMLTLFLCISIAFPVSAENNRQYTDKDSGVTFTIPFTWEETPLSDNRQYIDAKFVSHFYEGECILYGSTDIWSLMTESEKAGHTRSECDNSILTQNDYAEMFGVSPSSIEEITYNEKTYYQAVQTQRKTVNGISVTVTMTQLIRIENGWMYTFQVSGTSDDSHYVYFQDILSSVSYPATETENSSEITVMIVIIVVLSIVIIAFLILLKRKSSNQKAPNIQPLFVESPTYIYCHMCGARLLRNTSHCLDCGIFVGFE